MPYTSSMPIVARNMPISAASTPRSAEPPDIAAAADSAKTASARYSRGLKESAKSEIG